MPDPACPKPGAPARPVLSDARLRALLVICLFTYMAQNMLNASIAPLSRALGLHEWVVGLAVSSAALTVTMLSQFWGRRSVAWGRRRVLLISLSLAVSAGFLFALVVALRSRGLLGAPATAALIVVARGLLFGGAVAAIPPTGQALIAQITPDRPSRVRGMSAFSGSVQLAIVVGSLASSALGAWWIYAPVYATPAAVVLALGIGWWWVPRDGPAGTGSPGSDRAGRSGRAGGGGRAGGNAGPGLGALPPRVSWRDRRVVPWVGSAFGLFFTSGVVQITVGFLVQDRLGLAPQHAVSLTALMLLANAAGAMLTQLLLVPRLAWPPERLVRIGSTTALAALVALWASPGLWPMAASTFLIGVGGGLLHPGFTAGGSLAVSAAEQGGIAGLLQATASSTWVVAPVTATALYTWQPDSPFILAGAVLGLSTALAWTRLGTPAGGGGAGVAAPQWRAAS